MTITTSPDAGQVLNGLLLGLSMGAYCFATCGPLLAPWLLAEAQGPGRNVVVVLLFLGGRLVGYLVYGVLAWLVGWMFQSALPTWYRSVFGCAYISMAVMLVIYAIRTGRATCGTGATRSAWHGQRWLRHRFLMPCVGGLITGLNICYPFMLAFAAAAALPSLFVSVWFFLMFFLGTSIFILPLPLLGLLRRHQALQTIGRLSAGLVGCYYLYAGMVIIIQGVATGAPK